MLLQVGEFVENLGTTAAMVLLGMIFLNMALVFLLRAENTPTAGAIMPIYMPG